MLKGPRIFLFLLLTVALGFYYRVTYKERSIRYMSFILEENQYFTDSIPTQTENPKKATIETKTSTLPKRFNLSDILSKGNGVMFLETTDRMNPPSFVLCALESAARVYPDRPIVFFMKGLKEINSEEDQKKAKEHFPTLSSFNNIFFFSLRMEEIFRDTPLLPWYEKVNPEREEHWTHVSSDGCRLALNWKYGGIYMDTDIISIRRITGENFLAVESSVYVSNGVFGLLPQHNFTWWSMENFVENYNGAIWAHQGPHLFTRVLKQMCAIRELITAEDFMCKNITLLNPQRFYPIPYESWKLYYEVWEDLPTFNDSYALHLWNYMNVDHMTVVPGSNMLMEHLYQQFCPSTYGALQRNESTVL